MPDRTDKTNNNQITNSVTPMVEGTTESRENKEAKRVQLQQNICTFFDKCTVDKEAKSQHTVVFQVKAERLLAGKRLVPSGLGGRIHKEKAANSSKEAKEAATENKGRD